MLVPVLMKCKQIGSMVQFFGSMELWHRYFVILNAFALGILVLGQIFESGRFLFIRVGQAFP